MAHPIMFEDDEPDLLRLRALALAFPGAEEYVSHGRPNFKAGKNFAIYGGSERLGPGDHRRVQTALLVKIDPAELPAVDDDPRFFTPAYVGAYGWRGIELAADGTDWGEVAELLDASYRLVAPRRRVAELDAR